MTHRQIKLPRAEYEKALQVQKAIMKQKGEYMPLWKCVKYDDFEIKKSDPFRRIRL